jgi:hypothetical protein
VSGELERSGVGITTASVFCSVGHSLRQHAGVRRCGAPSRALRWGRGMQVSLVVTLDLPTRVGEPVTLSGRT